MARRRRIDDDHLLLSLIDDICKRTEYSDLLGTGTAQILFDIVDIFLRRTSCHCLPHYLFTVLCQFLRFGNISYFDSRIPEGFLCQVSSRISRRKHDSSAAPGQLPCDPSCNRRFADTALAHCEDDLFPAPDQIVDQIFHLLRFEMRKLDCLRRFFLGAEHSAKTFDAGQVEGMKLNGT